MTRLTPCAAVLVLLAAAPLAHAEDARLVVRTYPVSDIVLNVTDYPYQFDRGSSGRWMGGGGFGGGGGYGGGGGGMGGGGGAFSIEDIAYPAHAYGPPVRTIQFGGGGMASRPSNPGAALHTGIDMDGLIDAIVGCVATETWSENGGGEAEIRPLGGMLIISQTADIHQQIDALLNMIRQDAGRRQTVSIDARWLMLNSDELEALTSAPNAVGAKVADKALLKQLTRRAGSLRAMATCFSGQLIHMVSGTQQNSVTSYIPVVGSVDPLEYEGRLVSNAGRVPVRFVADATPVRESKVGYQPVISTVNLGVLLEIRPTVLPDGKAVIVDLASNLTVDGNRAPLAGPPAAGAELAPPVDRVATETARFASTFRMPIGEPVLVGGLSFSPNASLKGGPDADAGETRQAYLLLSIE